MYAELRNGREAVLTTRNAAVNAKVRRDRGESQGKVAGYVVKYVRDRLNGRVMTRVCAWMRDAWVFVGEWPCEFPPREEMASAIAGVEMQVMRERGR